MRYVKDFKRFNVINEASKSYKIDIALKKLDKFFSNNGFHKQMDFMSKVESPYYLLMTDKHYMNRMLNGYKDPNDSLTKELIKSGIDIQKRIMEVEKAIGEFNYGDISIFTDFSSKEIVDGLISTINSIGYFISVVNLKDGEKLKNKDNIKEELYNSSRISIMIEPIYDDVVDFDGEYLYHTTDSKNIDKIMRIGLTPKSKNTRSFYPERIYLSPNEKWMSSIRHQLVGDKGGDYVNLRIKNFDGLTLYKDVRFKGGFYTYNNIHPKYIEII